MAKKPLWNRAAARSAVNRKELPVQVPPPRHMLLLDVRALLGGQTKKAPLCGGTPSAGDLETAEFKRQRDRGFTGLCEDCKTILKQMED